MITSQAVIFLKAIKDENHQYNLEIFITIYHYQNTRLQLKNEENGSGCAFSLLCLFHMQLGHWIASSDYLN